MRELIFSGDINHSETRMKYSNQAPTRIIILGLNADFSFGQQNELTFSATRLGDHTFSLHPPFFSFSQSLPHARLSLPRVVISRLRLPCVTLALPQQHASKQQLCSFFSPAERIGKNRCVHWQMFIIFSSFILFLKSRLDVTCSTACAWNWQVNGQE